MVEMIVRVDHNFHGQLRQRHLGERHRRVSCAAVLWSTILLINKQSMQEPKDHSCRLPHTALPQFYGVGGR
jgi:hypothetical protein